MKKKRIFTNSNGIICIHSQKTIDRIVFCRQRDRHLACPWYYPRLNNSREFIQRDGLSPALWLFLGLDNFRFVLALASDLLPLGALPMGVLYPGLIVHRVVFA